MELIKDYQTICAALIAALVAALYYFSKARLDKAVFQRQLFSEYNKKYDELNDRLEKLRHLEFETAVESEQGNSKSLDDYWEELFEEPAAKSELVGVAFDYINLCSEEYYWYKKGYVELDVWKCWHNGMKSWYSDLYFMQKIVERERNKNAPYYNDDFLELFTKS